MRHLIPFLAATLILLNSCSSSRKAAQTPDDVYYSPGSSRTTAAASGDDAGYYSSAAAQRGDYYSTTPSDNYVRLKAEDPDRWSYFDDYNGYDSYYAPSAFGPYYTMGMGYGYPFYGYGMGMGMGYGFGLGFGDPFLCWNSYFLWNSYYNPYFYNPYYGGGVIVSHGVGVSTANPNTVYRLAAFNGAAYRNGLAARTSSSNNVRYYRPATTVNNRGVQNGYANPFNRSSNSLNNNNTYTNPGRSYSQPSFSQPVRSYTPSSGGSGGGGGGFRPSRH